MSSYFARKLIFPWELCLPSGSILRDWRQEKKTASTMFLRTLNSKPVFHIYRKDCGWPRISTASEVPGSDYARWLINKKLKSPLFLWQDSSFGTANDIADYSSWQLFSCTENSKEFNFIPTKLLLVTFSLPRSLGVVENPTTKNL